MAQTSGTTTALASGASGTLTGILIWHLKRYGVDMPPEVAADHVAIAMMLGGSVAHYIQVYIQVKLDRLKQSNTGSFGGPGQTPPSSPS